MNVLVCLFQGKCFDITTLDSVKVNVCGRAGRCKELNTSNYYCEVCPGGPPWRTRSSTGLKTNHKGAFCMSYVQKFVDFMTK